MYTPSNCSSNKNNNCRLAFNLNFWHLIYFHPIFKLKQTNQGLSNKFYSSNHFYLFIDTGDSGSRTDTDKKRLKIDKTYYNNSGRQSGIGRKISIKVILCLILFIHLTKYFWKIIPTNYLRSQTISCYMYYVYITLLRT